MNESDKSRLKFPSRKQLKDTLNTPTRVLNSFREWRRAARDEETFALYLASLKSSYETNESMKERLDVIVGSPVGRAAILELGLLIPGSKLLKLASLLKIATHHTIITPVLLTLLERQIFKHVLLSEQKMTFDERKRVLAGQNATLAVMIGEHPYKGFEEGFDPAIVVSTNLLRGSSSKMVGSFNYAFGKINPLVRHVKK